MISSGTVNCSECGRINKGSAWSCLWCGVALSVETDEPFFQPAQAELAYVGGIERLKDPTPVCLAIMAHGIEIIETMPGSRRVLIAAGSVVDARVIDLKTAVEIAEPVLQSAGLGGLGFKEDRKGDIPACPVSRQYTLTIGYRQSGELCSAVFRRQESTGLVVMQALARAITGLVRRANA